MWAPCRRLFAKPILEFSLKVIKVVTICLPSLKTSNTIFSILSLGGKKSVAHYVWFLHVPTFSRILLLDSREGGNRGALMKFKKNFFLSLGILAALVTCLSPEIIASF